MELTPLLGFGLTLLGIILAFLLRAVLVILTKEKTPSNGVAAERREDMSSMKRSIYDTERSVQEVKELSQGLAKTTTELEKIWCCRLLSCSTCKLPMTQLSTN